MLKISDAVAFLRANNLLVNWEDGQIALGIKRAIDQSAFAFLVDAQGKLTSLVFGEWLDETETFHVTAFAGKNSARHYINYLKKTFPRCKHITMGRRGKLKEYNFIRTQTTKFLKERN